VSAPITETIKKLADSESAEIDLTTKDKQVIRLNCVYKVSDAPNFFLVFPPKTLPSNIDTDQYCPISIKNGKSSLTLTARILKISGDRTIELSAKNSINSESLREYFRVDTRVAINAHFEPESPDGKIQSWELEGQTLDLSASGLLAILPEEPPTKHQIAIKIHLKSIEKNVQCLGHVVRSKRLRKGRYQVAFHFDSISQKHRDTIISFCLQEQRNNLREKIQTAG